MARNPSLGEAHAALGLYFSNVQEWDKCEANYRRAIELNPNYPLAHEWLSALLVGTGRFEEGVKEILLAERLDPLSLRQKVMSAWTIYQAGDIETALTKAKEVLSLSPDYLQSHLQTANCLLETGEAEEALVHARRATELSVGSPLPSYTLCFALVAAGHSEKAAAVVHGLTEAAKSAYISPYFLALSQVAIGDTDAALDSLELAEREKNAWMLWLGTEPKLDSLRGHPRFEAIIESAGIPYRRTPKN